MKNKFLCLLVLMVILLSTSCKIESRQIDKLPAEEQTLPINVSNYLQQPDSIIIDTVITVTYHDYVVINKEVVAIYDTTVIDWQQTVLIILCSVMAAGFLILMITAMI